LTVDETLFSPFCWCLLSVSQQKERPVVNIFKNVVVRGNQQLSDPGQLIVMVLFPPRQRENEKKTAPTTMVPNANPSPSLFLLLILLPLFYAVVTMVEASITNNMNNKKDATVPPIPLMIEFNGERIMLHNEKQLDLLHWKYPNSTIIKLYEREKQWKQWYSASASAAVAVADNETSHVGNTHETHHCVMNPEWDQYHNYSMLTTLLQEYASIYSNMTQLFSIGTSVRGRQLWMMKIFYPPVVATTNTTTNTNTNTNAAALDNNNKGNELKEKPKFKYIANIHGDETVGRELLIRLIDYILTEFNMHHNERMIQLLSQVDLYIMPSNNPDGYELNSRYNANGYDLNRNFPDPFRPLGSGIEQPETSAMRRFISSHRHFVLSAHLHGGSLVASYGLDGLPSGKDSSMIYSASPDDLLNRYLSSIYAQNHLKMSFKQYNAMFGGEPHYGTVNGAYWYTLYGGAQDYDYRIAQCNAVTMELSFIKNPPANTLNAFWNDNVHSLLAYMEQSYKSVIGGYVRDAVTGGPLLLSPAATHQNYVYVSGIEGHNITIHNDSIYYRMLVPDHEYNVTFVATGYHSHTICGVKITDAANRTSILRIDVMLKPKINDNDSVVSVGCDEYFDKTPPNPNVIIATQYGSRRVAFVLISIITLMLISICIMTRRTITKEINNRV
jgi:hypothetical protein